MCRVLRQTRDRKLGLKWLPKLQLQVGDWSCAGEVSSGQQACLDSWYMDSAYHGRFRRMSGTVTDRLSTLLLNGFVRGSGMWLSTITRDKNPVKVTEASEVD